MAANLLCARTLQGHSLRFTRLDGCGNVDYGDSAYAVSTGYVEAVITPNVEDGERFLQRGANGVPIINQRSRPSLNWYDISVQFQEVNPQLFTLATGHSPYEDDQDRVIGLTVAESTFATANFALEIWLGNAEEECSGNPTPYGYNLLPWVVEGAITDDITVANDMITFTLTGRTRTGTPWGVGPYDVFVDMNGDPSPLFTAIPADTHHLMTWTFLAPPTPTCDSPSLSS